MEGFDDSAIEMLVVFNVFCGISLDNAKLLIMCRSDEAASRIR